ncbi:MAG: Lrp/AsnC family transcriptional regulator [Christensenellales bacterium]
MEPEKNLEAEILEVLEKDARTPHDTLAIMLGVSVEEIDKEIERMERENIIVQYTAAVNWNKTNHSAVEALIEVRVSPQRNYGFDAMARRIYRYPEVRSVYLVSGGYDLLVQVEGASLHEVAYFVSSKLSVIDNVISTSTHFILKKYKTDGIVMDDPDADPRLVVAP